MDRPVLDSQYLHLRVVLLTGCLDRGGAEKQAVYMARALLAAGVDIRVCSITQGGYYKSVLEREGIRVNWVGFHSNPALRVWSLIRQVASFRPNVIQASHAHNNIHVALAARVLNCVSLGGLRTDLNRYRGPWARTLFRAPTGIIANSLRAVRQLRERGAVRSDRVWYLPNAIDLSEFSDDSESHSNRSGNNSGANNGAVTALFLGRSIPAKRLDLFLRALAAAVNVEPRLRGLVVGEGPELGSMKKLARELGLTRNHIHFFGATTERISEVLSQVDFLTLCSDYEGCPNSVLEAMAARKPVIVTPAGDASHLVKHGTGYVVPFGDVDAISRRMLELTRDPKLREKMGKAGRRRVETIHNIEGLAKRLLGIYSAAAA